MTLQSLITRIEAGSGSDRQLDADICVALQCGSGPFNPRNFRHTRKPSHIVLADDDGGFNLAYHPPHLTSSLDAIRALMIARLEGYSLTIGSYQSGAGASVYKDSCGPTDVLNPDVHRAFLSATLKAIAAKEG